MHQLLVNWRGPVLVGLLGWVAVVATRSDPGITSDEPFSVVYGIDFVSRLSDRGWDFFTRESINETFTERNEHPPLGRWLIGGVHRLVTGKRNTPVPGVQDILDARLAPASALALMLMLLTRVVGARLGNGAGIASGIALLLMPRVFAHAHFAALDTFMSCSYLLGVLSAAWMMECRRPWLAAPWAGFFLGLALLTKIHGVFLPPLVGLWGLCWFRFRSMLPWTIWVASGVFTFIAGWPWLWSDLEEFWTMLCGDGVVRQHLFSRLSGYLGTSLDRAAIFVSYPGGPYRDTEVPWHYPYVMFVLAVPVGIHVLAACGVWQHLTQRRGDHRAWLYLMAVFFPLVVFSVPGIPVYDGVRLFLMAFPFWAAFAGQGAGWLYERLQQWWGSRTACAVLSFFLAFQAWGVFYYHPFQLSYYNSLVGGLRGAARAGFEVTYWGDSVTTDLLDRWSAAVPDETCGVLVPTLYKEQAELYQTSGMVKRRQRLIGFSWPSCPYVVVYNRRAYLDGVTDLIDDPSQKPVQENVVDGVWVTRVYVRPSRRAARGELDETGGF